MHERVQPERGEHAVGVLAHPHARAAVLRRQVERHRARCRAGRPLARRTQPAGRLGLERDGVVVAA